MLPQSPPHQSLVVSHQAYIQGQGLKPRTKAKYTLLIDMTPSDPTTMKNAKLEAKRLTKKAGQATTLLLQIFNSIVWVSMYSGLTQNFLVRTSYFLMSYVSAVGILMAGSGLEEESCLWGCNENAHW